MEDLEKLLEELQKYVEDTATDDTSTQQTQTQTTQTQSQPQQTPSQDDEVEERLNAYRELGAARFIAKYGQMPNFSKIYPIVVQRADALLYQDLNKGSVKDEYLDYMEQALGIVLKETKDIVSPIYDFIKSSKQQNSSSQKLDVDYKMADYNNDYKKYLIKTTMKGIPLEFRDGYKNEKGRVQTVAEGEAKYTDTEIVLN
jgi:hypothetical protein